MPSRIDTMGPRLRGTRFDRSRKLSDQDRLDIKDWHRNGVSIHEISRTLCVDRRLIQFILFPERHAKNLADRAARGGSKQYYNKQKWKLAMRRHRAHKREVAEILGTKEKV